MAAGMGLVSLCLSCEFAVELCKVCFCSVPVHVGFGERAQFCGLLVRMLLPARCLTNYRIDSLICSRA
ncbi:hypothetical protein PR202_gb25626 [Eleusine coracana subsp. coracana]|uniref:Secreted protein n=1 Tax=Eleusine coracana subsp. coracana TaxID=191504 RepID=A0AAV5FM45_ELECO|nr:hypothetical protein PR202_gb25626 [Eleusine coracana subsp. coracana]